MEWIIEPLKGFKEIVPVLNDSCSQWAVCTCTGGLIVCSGKGSLEILPPK
jgi:hypothetical protein